MGSSNSKTGPRFAPDLLKGRRLAWQVRAGEQMSTRATLEEARKGNIREHFRAFHPPARGYFLVDGRDHVDGTFGLHVASNLGVAAGRFPDDPSLGPISRRKS